MFTDDEQEIIYEGDEAGHYGSPIVDALMFKQGVRPSHHGFLYKELYGLEWQQVLQIGESLNPPRIWLVLLTLR